MTGLYGDVTGLYVAFLFRQARLGEAQEARVLDEDAEVRFTNPQSSFTSPSSYFAVDDLSRAGAQERVVRFTGVPRS